MELTQKQSLLLDFIYRYRFDYGRTPALKDMVGELNISDNKSALRMIDSLVEKGYLNREMKKTKTVTLSDKGYQLVSNVLSRYQSTPSELKRSKLPNVYGQSGISVSLPLSNNLSHQQQKVDTSGTGTGIDVNTIIETAVNLAISKYFGGSWTTAFDSQILKNTDTKSLVFKITNEIKQSTRTQWGLVIVLLTSIFSAFTGNTMVAFCYAILSSLFIKYLIKE